MNVLSHSTEHFLELLHTRHEALLKLRIAKKPRQFKDVNNRAGYTEFVDWQLVSGKLEKDYQWYGLLQNPFDDACYIMFLIAEVYPFLEGNSRIARIMMNAELTAKGDVQNNYSYGLSYRLFGCYQNRRLTRKNEPEIYVQMLERSYEFSSTVHNKDIDEVERYLRKCNAFKLGEEDILRF